MEFPHPFSSTNFTRPPCPTSPPSLSWTAPAWHPLYSKGSPVKAAAPMPSGDGIFLGSCHLCRLIGPASHGQLFCRNACRRWEWAWGCEDFCFCLQKQKHTRDRPGCKSPESLSLELCSEIMAPRARCSCMHEKSRKERQGLIKSKQKIDVRIF
jgi:hypothetical protein